MNVYSYMPRKMFQNFILIWLMCVYKPLLGNLCKNEPILCVKGGSYGDYPIKFNRHLDSYLIAILTRHLDSYLIAILAHIWSPPWLIFDRHLDSKSFTFGVFFSILHLIWRDTLYEEAWNWNKTKISTPNTQCGEQHNRYFHLRLFILITNII